MQLQIEMHMHVLGERWRRISRNMKSQNPYVQTRIGIMRYYFLKAKKQEFAAITCEA